MFDKTWKENNTTTPRSCCSICTIRKNIMIIFARKNAISICLLTLLSHSSISAKDCNAKDYDLSPEIHDLYPNIADGTFEEQHPSAAALAQVGFSHPFMCSALLSTVLCMTYNVLAQKSPSFNVLHEGFLLSTFLGWPVIFRLCHHYLMNTHITHHKTEWCNDHCIHFDSDSVVTCTVIQQIIAVSPQLDNEGNKPDQMVNQDLDETPEDPTEKNAHEDSGVELH